MNKNWCSFLIVGAVACGVMGCASPPPKGRGGPGQPGGQVAVGTVVAQPTAILFASYDLNRDRIISMDEFEAAATAEWALASPTGQPLGLLDLRSWKITSLGHQDVEPGSRQFDYDGDGMTTSHEFKGYLERRFSSLDKNADGQLSREELVRVIALPQQRGGNQGGMPMGGGGRPSQPPRR